MLLRGREKLLQFVANAIVHLLIMVMFLVHFLRIVPLLHVWDTKNELENLLALMDFGAENESMLFCVVRHGDGCVSVVAIPVCLET